MSTRKILTTLLFAVFAFAANAQESTQTQTAAKMKAFAGDVTVKIPGGSAVQATVGMTLPQGAEVVTGANAQATVELHDGIVAVMGQNSTADLEKLSIDAKGVRTGLVSLKSGTIASSLDPKKKSINNYAVKTPKGVAAARGTTFSVNYNGATYSCTVVGGQVLSMTVTQFTTLTASNSFFAGALNNTSLVERVSGVEVNAGELSISGNEATVSDTLPIAAAIAAGGNDAVNTSGLPVNISREALTAADAANGLALLAAAVASVSTNVNDVTAVIQTIAASAGNSPAATNAVASATAAAAATAATNASLNGGATGTASTAAATSVAQQIVQAAVQGSVQAGNNTASATIVATTTAAVAATTNTTNAAATSSVTNLAAALTQTANNVQGSTTVDAGQVTTAAQQVTSNPNTAVGTATQTNTTVTTTPGAAPPTSQAPQTPVETPVVTAPQPIDPTTVSRSN